MLANALERLVQFIVLVAIISLVWWILTHPATAAGLLVTIAGGVVGFVNVLVTGIAGLIH